MSWPDVKLIQQTPTYVPWRQYFNLCSLETILESMTIRRCPVVAPALSLTCVTDHTLQVTTGTGGSHLSVCRQVGEGGGACGRQVRGYCCTGQVGGGGGTSRLLGQLLCWSGLKRFITYSESQVCFFFWGGGGGGGQ